MRDCPVCGKPVRLGAQRIRANRKQGVYHYIVHKGTGNLPCVPGDWSTVMLKPYPKREEDKPRFQMVQRWEALQRPQVGTDDAASSGTSGAFRSEAPE